MNYIYEMLDMFYYMFTNLAKTEMCEYFFYLFIMALVFIWVREAVTW